jgi:ubiquinol-cytochrome c reductase cytochrome b subunit
MASETPETDENGVRGPGTSRIERLRLRLNRGWYQHNVQKPTRAELEEAHHHAEHEHALQSGLDHPADGHQFDGHHTVDEEALRGKH